MKYYNNKFIIGIDHGYGNIKTANRVFFVDDIRAAARGYEYMAELQFERGVRI